MSSAPEPVSGSRRHRLTYSRSDRTRISRRPSIERTIPSRNHSGCRSGSCSPGPCSESSSPLVRPPAPRGCKTKATRGLRSRRSRPSFRLRRGLFVDRPRNSAGSRASAPIMGGAGRGSEGPGAGAACRGVLPRRSPSGLRARCRSASRSRYCAVARPAASAADLIRA